MSIHFELKDTKAMMLENCQIFEKAKDQKLSGSYIESTTFGDFEDFIRARGKSGELPLSFDNFECIDIVVKEATIGQRKYVNIHGEVIVCDVYKCGGIYQKVFLATKEQLFYCRSTLLKDASHYVDFCITDPDLSYLHYWPVYFSNSYDVPGAKSHNNSQESLTLVLEKLNGDMNYNNIAEAKKMLKELISGNNYDSRKNTG